MIIWVETQQHENDEDEYGNCRSLNKVKMKRIKRIKIQDGMKCENLPFVIHYIHIKHVI